MTRGRQKKTAAPFAARIALLLALAAAATLPAAHAYDQISYNDVVNLYTANKLYPIHTNDQAQKANSSYWYLSTTNTLDVDYFFVFNDEIAGGDVHFGAIIGEQLCEDNLGTEKTCSSSYTPKANKVLELWMKLGTGDSGTQVFEPVGSDSDVVKGTFSSGLVYYYINQACHGVKDDKYIQITMEWDNGSVNTHTIGWTIKEVHAYTSGNVHTSTSYTGLYNIGGQSPRFCYLSAACPALDSAEYQYEEGGSPVPRFSHTGTCVSNTTASDGSCDLECPADYTLDGTPGGGTSTSLTCTDGSLGATPCQFLGNITLADFVDISKPKYLWTTNDDSSTVWSVDSTAPAGRFNWFHSTNTFNPCTSEAAGTSSYASEGSCSDGSAASGSSTRRIPKNTEIIKMILRLGVVDAAYSPFKQANSLATFVWSPPSSIDDNPLVYRINLSCSSGGETKYIDVNFIWDTSHGWVIQKITDTGEDPVEQSDLCIKPLGCDLSAVSASIDVTSCGGGSTLAEGENCTVSCTGNYIMDGDATLSCGSGGTISGPTCRAPNNCTVTVTNGNCGSGVLQHGASCTVTCDSDYGLTSDAASTVVCTDGTASAVPTCHKLAPDSTSVTLSAPLDSGAKHISIRNANDIPISKIYFNTPGNDNWALHYLAIFDTEGNNVFADLPYQGYPVGHAQRGVPWISDWSQANVKGFYFVSTPHEVHARHPISLQINNGGSTLSPSGTGDKGFAAVFDKPTYIDRIEYRYDVVGHAPFTAGYMLNAYAFADAGALVGDSQKGNSDYTVSLNADPFSSSDVYRHNIASANVDHKQTLPTQLNIDNGAVKVEVETLNDSTMARYLAITGDTEGDDETFVLAEMQVFDSDGNEITGLKHSLSDMKFYDYYFRVDPANPSSEDNMFDGDFDNMYVTSTNTRPWIIIVDLGRVYEVGTVKITSRKSWRNFHGVSDSETAITGFINFGRASFTTTFVDTVTRMCNVSNPTTECKTYTDDNKATFGDDYDRAHNQGDPHFTDNRGQAFFEFSFPGKVVSTPQLVASVDVNGVGKMYVQYPFRRLDISMKDGESVKLLVDEVPYTSATPADLISFSSNSIDVKADNSRWTYVGIEGTKLVGTEESSMMCGDSIVQPNEACDDGNRVFGDGCNIDCQIQARYECPPQIYKTNFLTTTQDFCVLEDYKCGDRLVDRSAAFHTQQQYRRVPFSNMSATHPNVIDPNQCAVAIPGLTCSVNNTEITFPGSDGKQISKFDIYATGNLTVTLYSDATCLTVISYFTNSLEKVTPVTTRCVKVEGTAIHSIKLYEAVGHVEECDGESYCDPETCQLEATAYCKPRPDPVPLMIFSAKRSHFEHNSMYSGLMTSVAGPFNYWPRLVASDTHMGVISPTNYSNKIVLSGYDVQPAGGSLLLGTAGTFTAFVMLSSDSTDIVSFTTNTTETIKLAYASPNFELSNAGTSETLSLPLVSSKETFIALVFSGSNVTLYAANEGAVSLESSATLGYTGSVSLTEIHVATIEYLTVASVYKNAHTEQEMLEQFQFQDVYGAGRNCTEDARTGDGVLDNGEVCDDGNLDNDDGCICTIDGACVLQDPQPFTCSHPELWTVIDNIINVTFTADAGTEIEEVQFFAPDREQIKLAGASVPTLADGVWNTPGSTADVSAAIDGASFTFQANTKIEYIRIYNSRSGDNSHFISTIKVSVNGAVPFNVGFSSNGEWTCSDSESGFGTGDCTDSKYPGFVDLVHDAQQTNCQCDVTVSGGQCGSYASLMPLGKSCTVTCDAGYSLALNAEALVTCNSDFSASSVPTCHELAPNTSSSTVALPADGVISVRPKNFGKAARRLIVEQHAWINLAIDYVNIVDTKGESFDWTTYIYNNGAAYVGVAYNKGTYQALSHNDAHANGARSGGLNDIGGGILFTNGGPYIEGGGAHEFRTLIVTFSDGMYIDHIDYKFLHDTDRWPQTTVWTLEFEDGSTSVHNPINHDLTTWNVYYNYPAEGYMPTLIEFGGQLSMPVVENGASLAIVVDGKNIPYPFTKLDVHIKNGYTTNILADGVSYTSDSALSYSTSPVTVSVSANADLWSVVRAGSTVAFGDAAVLCGDGIIHADETCDDTNSAYDGCSATCTVENPYTCSSTAIAGTQFLSSSCSKQMTFSATPTVITMHSSVKPVKMLQIIHNHNGDYTRITSLKLYLLNNVKLETGSYVYEDEEFDATKQYTRPSWVFKTHSWSASSLEGNLGVSESTSPLGVFTLLFPEDGVYLQNIAYNVWGYRPLLPPGATTIDYTFTVTYIDDSTHVFNPPTTGITGTPTQGNVEAIGTYTLYNLANVEFGNGLTLDLTSANKTFAGVIIPFPFETIFASIVTGTSTRDFLVDDGVSGGLTKYTSDVITVTANAFVQAKGANWDLLQVGSTTFAGDAEALCGDGVVQPGASETCDDGNTNATDGCNACKSPGYDCTNDPIQGTGLETTSSCAVSATPQCTALSFPSAESSSCNAGNNDGSVCSYMCPASGYIAASQLAYTCDGTATQFKPNTIVVTVQHDGSGNRFHLLGSFRPSLNLMAGQEYTFDISGTSDPTHIFKIKDSGSNAESGVKDGDMYRFTPEADKTYEYYCSVPHPNMGAAISVQNALCEAVTCPGNPTTTISGAEPFNCGASTGHNIACTSSCRQGYSGAGLSSTCTNGTWGPVSGSCTINTCAVTLRGGTTTNCTNSSVEYGQSCLYECDASISSYTIECGENGDALDVSDIDCTFTCPVDVVQYTGKNACKCPNGQFRAACDGDIQNINEYAVSAPVSTRRRLRKAGAIFNKDLVDNKFINAKDGKELKLHRDAGGNNIPEFDAYSLTIADSGLNIVFPTKTFRSVLRFETIGDAWAGDATHPLKVYQEKPDGYDPGTSKPIHGFYFNRDSQQLEKHVTRIDGDFIVYDVPHFSEHGTADFDPECGNGQVEQNEACDDGNSNDGDGCSSSCTIETGYHCPTAGDFNTPSVCGPECGDGLRVGDEQCDNGDATGCDNTACTVDNNYYCTGGSATTIDTCSQCSESMCGFDKYLASCGTHDNGTCMACTTAIDDQTYYSTHGALGDATTGCPTTACDAEQCVSGQFLDNCGGLNAGSCSVCTSTSTAAGAHFFSRGTAGNPGSCTVKAYNDGEITSGPSISNPSNIITEACDDGNAQTGDGCHDGQIENGWSCNGAGAGSCTPLANDGTKRGDEECDDGNGVQYDGCFDGQIEVGYFCLHTPCDSTTAAGSALFNTTCGDGQWARGIEGCDPSIGEDAGEHTECDTDNCIVTPEYTCRHKEGDTGSVCSLIVLDLDPTTGCVIIPTPGSGNTVTYNGNEAIQGVVTNHTNANGIDYVVPKCLVCATPITIENVPDAEDRPKFLAPCVLKAPAALTTVCPLPQVGDGRLSGAETCDDGNTANGDGCTDNGVLEAELADKRFAIAIAQDPNDGYISGSEVIDFSPGLHSDACSDNTVASYQNLQCPGYDVEQNGKKYMYYFIRQHGKTTTLSSLNRPAVVETVTTNDFANDQRGLFKFHQSRPSVASTSETYAKTLDGQANSVTVAVQCFKNDADSSVLNLLETPPPQDCPTGENKQILASAANPTACKLSSVPAELDVGEYCGYQYAQTARQRVYVWSAESGNMYVDVTTLLGDADASPAKTNKFRYLSMLNFRAELRAADVADISITPSNTANTESTTSQEITFTTSQSVTFAGLEDAKFVRKLSVAATNAVGYNTATAYNTISSNGENRAAVSESGNDLYTVLLSGTQAAKAVYTVPAYRNTAEQNGLMSVQVTSVVYACDHASGSQEFTQDETAANVHIQAVIYDLDNTEIAIAPAPDYTEGGSFILNIQWSEVTDDTSGTRAWKSVQCCANNIAADKDAPTVSTQPPFTTVNAGHGCFNTTSTYWGQKPANQTNDLLRINNGLDVTVTPCDYATQDIQYECRIEVEETNFDVSEPYGALNGVADYKNAPAATTAIALVPHLDIGQSFTDASLVLVAGGAAQTVKVCTDVWENVRNSNCSNSEAVSLSQFQFSGMGENAATGLHLNSQFLTVDGGAVMGVGNSLVNHDSDFSTVCKDYVISASQEAATCNAADITVTRNHRVSEKGVDKDESYAIKLTIDERACPFDVDQNTIASQVDEDGNIPLASMFTIKRQSDCGASESVKSVTFSVSAGYSTDVKINNNDFSTGSITILGDDAQLDNFDSLFTSGGGDNVTFIGGAVRFAQDFNTINNPDITLFATFVSEDCGGHSTQSTQVSRTIAVRDTMDSCAKTVNVQNVEPTRGNWIHVPVEAKIDNLDEYRLFKMTITSSMAIEYKLQRSGDKVDCQGSNNYGVEQSCVLYCTDDGTNAGERTSSFWAPTGSGSEHICSNFQHLYVRPKFDNTLNLAVQHDIYSPTATGCAASGTPNILLCSGFAGPGSVANTYIDQPYAGTMYLKFDSEIGQSDGTTQPCTLSQNFHKYDIQGATIVGEVLSTTNGNAVTFTENGDLSETTISISGANLNAETVSFEFERRDHLEFQQSENGLYIALNITSQNCRDENNNALNFKLYWTQIQWIFEGSEGFTWLDGEKNTKAFTLKRDDDTSTANVGSNCQIVVDASEHEDNSIFFPLYTTSAKITFDISANLGEIDTVDNQASVTDQPLLDISYKRVGGYDGVLTVDFTASLVGCNQGGVHFSDDITASSAQLVWANGIDITPKTIRVNFIGGPSNCQAEVVANVNSGAFIKTFIIQLSGDLGTAHINNKPMSTTSLTLLKGQGQTFTVERTAAKVAKYVVTKTDSSVSLSTQDFEWTQLDQDNGLLSKTFVVQWGNAQSGTDNLELKLQLQTFSGGTWNNIGNEISYYFSVQDDKNDCTFAKIESATVVVGSSVQPVASTSYSHYVDKYVVLTEGAQHFFGDSFHDQITYTISRPANSDGIMQFKLALASFDVEDTGVFKLTPSHFVGGLTETYSMQANEQSMNITLTLVDDELNSGGEQLGFLYATFDDALDLSTGNLSPDEKSAIITGCNANAAVSTSLSQNIRQTVTQYSSARRLLAAAVNGRGNGDANILKKEDDVTAPLTQPTTESFAARFWSSASLDKWSSALEVEMTFNVPVYEAGYADSSYGSFAQIGACPTEVDTLFDNMASCTTFVPLSTSYGSTIEYVRALAGLDSGSATECSNLTFPCPERWKEPLGQFESSTTMTNVAVSSAYPDLAVFPYQYKGNLNQLQNCKLVDGVTDAVTTTASGGFTQYEFDTCIVTYGPRYAAANNSDVVLHTAKQHVVLSSSNEAVVTAIMFETNDRIRVSIEPTQKSCGSSDCTNAYGPEHDCANGHYTYLELLVHVDVPYDDLNEYGFTGVYDAATIEAAATGCHWAAGVGAIYDGSVAPTVSKITRYETRNGASSPSGYTYIRSTFTLKTPCMSAADSSGPVTDTFSTCAAGSSKDPTDYDFKAQMGSCKTEAAMQACIGGSCSATECILSGNRQEKTLIQADITFVEMPPTVNLEKTTAVALESAVFKYGTSQEVTYGSGVKQSFTVKDTLVLAVAPADPGSFVDSHFALACPDTFLAAYNPVNEQCTTAAAQEWTYTTQSVTSKSFDCETDPDADCGDCGYAFPLALAGQSVLFDGPATVRICSNATTVLKSMPVAMLDHVHSYWYEFYQNDYRAVAADCEARGNCRRPCTGTPTQSAAGCGQCKEAGAFGAGKWILPILTATQIVSDGNVAPDHRVSFIQNSANDVRMCKHDNASTDGFGNTDGWNEHEVCNGATANTPRACGFPGLDGTAKFNPDTNDANQVYISEGVSIFCGGLLPDTLYSLSSHCYITNCQSNGGNSARRLLQVAGEHDAVVTAGDGEPRHIAAKGIEFFHIQGDSLTATDDDSTIAGLGSTIAITLGVVALVVIALMSISWVWMYKRAYSTRPLPTYAPAQTQQTVPLMGGEPRFSGSSSFVF